MKTRQTMVGGLAMAVGATLLSTGLVLLSPRDARAFDSRSAQSSLKDAASRLRDLASEKAIMVQKDSTMSTGKQGYDWHKQTAWLQKAADRCEELASQMMQAGSQIKDPKKLELNFTNLRKTLLSESASKAGQAAADVKARQDKANEVLRGLK